jgi:Leucine-rich repeat (LRR) protein
MMFKKLAAALVERENVTALKITIKEKTLPPELFVFPNLKELYLEAPALLDFPHDVSGWSALTLLQLKAPAFKGSLAPVFRLPRLVNLKTSDTPLHPLKLALGGAAAPLRFLTLKDAGLKVLPLEFGELTTIEEMHLMGNELTELPVTFKQLAKLRWLNLDSNQFKTFPAVLGQLPSLKHLSLDGNAFSEEEKERIQRDYHLTVD